jgi:CRP/FNR family transcriptional regulator
MTSEALQIDTILREHYPDFSAALRAQIAEVATIRSVKAGDTLMDIGNYIKSSALIYEGMIKVFRESESGNEMFLYYLYPGQACAITFACTANVQKSNIRAIAMKDTSFVAIPIASVDDWMSLHKSWNHFVIGTFRGRFEEMLETIDQVAFQKMDERLVNHLKRTSKAQESLEITTSHQEIANELNSSREVISRLLKKLENDGQVKIHRGRISLTGLSVESGSFD